MGSEDFSCRVATKSDGATLIAFNVALACETEAKKLDPAIISSGVERLFDRPEYGFYIVAESQGKIAGSLLITFEWSDWRDGLFWWIQSVYVAPEFRRRGVYRALHSCVRDLAKHDKDVRGLRLYAEGQNTGAHRAYEQLGMTETTYKFFEEVFPAGERPQ